MQLTFLGTNNLLLRNSGTTILVDPHFTRPRLRELIGKISANAQTISAELDRNGIDHLDGVLLTHMHYDHALDAAEVIRQAGSVLFGCNSAMILMNHDGRDKQQSFEITLGTTYQIGAFTVTFHPSQHLPFPGLVNWLMPMDENISQPLETPTWFWHYPRGTVSAIQVDQTLIFGSAGYLPGAYQNLDIENIVLGIGGLDLKPKSYLECLYREAVLFSGAKQVYLSHWDNFFKPASRDLKPHFLVRKAINRIKALGAQHGQTVQVLQFRDSYSL